MTDQRKCCHGNIVDGICIKAGAFNDLKLVLKVESFSSLVPNMLTQ